ncbi:CPBP family intramembrane glutamic endopeptidase [Rubrobacter indicoceani]|uniref:CPBP family intramembrane glutamic endopeptidase n=1 Tax=Rubrobacter indicoceani TaxID=2051957 RepID=UPI001968CDB4|nr:CPBP family intramembrane glutamic endopeptidase [Rubrobacter indicoceani]
MIESLLTLVLALFVGGLAVLAQVARKSRQAAITLAVVLLAASLVVLLLGTFVGLGLLAQVSGGGSFTGGERAAYSVALVVVVFSGLLGIAICVPLFRRILGQNLRREFWGDPVIAFSLWVGLLVLVNNVVSFLIFTVESDISSLFSGVEISPVTVLSSQLPFVIIAAMGVGVFIRRNLRETLERLGYKRINIKQFGIVLGFIVVALGASFGTDSLFRVLQPDLYQRVGEISDNLFNPTGLTLGSAVLLALLVGIGAGLGEETLFRGALQPVFGIVVTSLLFASMHIQYGPSLLLVYILVLSVGLGLIRKHINTTASFLAHAGYNAATVMIGYFFS